MRPLFRVDPVRGGRPGVRAEADEGILQGGPDVVLSHHEDDALRVRAVGEDDVHQRVARILLHERADLLERPALVLLELGAENGGEHDAGSATRAVPLVLPGFGVFGHLVPDASPAPPGSRRRARSLSRPPSPHPRRQARVQPVRARVPGILIRRDVQPRGARGVERGENPRHRSPVAPVGRLQVPHVRRDAGFAGDPEHFRERRVDPISLGALVREVHAATGRRDLRAGDDLVGRVVEVGNVLERRGDLRARRLPWPVRRAPSSVRARSGRLAGRRSR